MGICVATSTLHLKKKQLVAKHEEMKEEILDKYVSQVESRVGALETLANYSAPTVDSLGSACIASPCIAPSQPVRMLDSPTTIASPLNTDLVALPNGAGFSSPRVSIPSTHMVLQNQDCYTSANLYGQPAPTMSWNSSPVFASTKPEVPVGLIRTKKTNVELPQVQNFEYVSNMKAPSDPAMTVQATQERTEKCLHNVLRKVKEDPGVATECIGDNLDILVSPSTMTSERQRKSWHWFLAVTPVKRILGHELSNSAPKQDIIKVENLAWLPTTEEMAEYTKNLCFHVSKVLVKYLDSLKDLSPAVPGHIDHPYMEESKQRSTILNTDLIESGEGSAQGIIEIVQRIHDSHVPHTRGKEQKILERVVLGGDVFTNECAFNAQRHIC